MLAVLTPWVRIPQDNADGAGMLAHLHGFFVGWDLLYDDEYAELGMSPLFAFVTRPAGGSGVVSNHWPAGASWLQAPGYLLGLLGYEVLHGLDLVGTRARWVIPLLGVRAWALALLWAWARGVRRWIGDVLGDRAGIAVAAAGVVGTPMLYYAAEAPLRPHLYGAIVVTLLVWLWATPPADEASRQGSAGMTRAAALGALSGLAAAIRPQLAPLFLLVLHDVSPGAEGRRGRLLAAFGSAAIWPLLGLRLQWWMYGDGVSSYATGETSHHLAHLLWSPYHGVLTWIPIVALGVVGLVVGGLRRERGAWLLVGLFAMQLWIDAGQRPIEPFHVLGTRTWGGGTAFGPRKLLDALPLLIPGVIWLVQGARERLGEGTGGALVGGMALLACLPTLGLHLASFVDPNVTAEVMDLGLYRSALTLGLDPALWGEAVARRALPWKVVLVLAGVVALPIATMLAWWVRTTGGRPLELTVIEARTTGWAIGLGVAAHLWMAMLISRSDGLLHDQPERMFVASQRLDPAHEQLVPVINAAAWQLQAKRLGPAGVGPAPPGVDPTSGRYSGPEHR